MQFPNCPGNINEIKDDGKPGCNCGNGKFNPNTRGCYKNECSLDLFKNCTEKRAEVCILDGNNEKALCQCKEDEFAYSPTNDPETWECMPKCDILNNPDFLNYK